MIPMNMRIAPGQAHAAPAGAPSLASGMAGIAGPVHAAIQTPQQPTPQRPVMGVNAGEMGQPWNLRFSQRGR